MPRIHLQFAEVALDLDYIPDGGEWLPEGDGMLLRNKKGFLRWLVTHPSADVRGRATLKNRTLDLAGRGYIDVVEMTIPPWRLPISKLRWGRAHCGSWTIVFNELSTIGGECRQSLLVRNAASRPTVNPAARFETQRADSESPRSFALSSDAAGNDNLVAGGLTLSFGWKRDLVKTPVATEERIRPKLLREFAARICGNPVEHKLVSDASLTIGTESAHGTAVHECVVWNWGKEGRGEEMT